LAVIFILATGAGRAGESAGPKSITPLLKSIPFAELPRQAAEMVAQAGSNNMRQTTFDVVKAAVCLNPAAAPAIVGCIAKSTPSMAATAAATAVTVAPELAVFIARAAAGEAPAEAGAIVEALCRRLPRQYLEIAEAVAQFAPHSESAILEGIRTAIPSLNVPLDQALASGGGKAQPLTTVLLNSTSLSSSLPLPVIGRPLGITESKLENLADPIIDPPPLLNPLGAGPRDGFEPYNEAQP
jgi:hypothetical protein